MEPALQEICEAVVASWLRSGKREDMEKYLRSTLGVALESLLHRIAVQRIDEAVSAYCEAGVARRAPSAGIDELLDRAVRDWHLNNLDALLGQMIEKEVTRAVADAVHSSVIAALRSEPTTALIDRCAISSVERWIANGEVQVPSLTPATRRRITTTLNRFGQVRWAGAEKAALGTLAEAWKITQEGHDFEAVAAGLGISTTQAQNLVERATERINELREQLARFEVIEGAAGDKLEGREPA
jgi:uncharacterized protein with PIN domain